MTDYEPGLYVVTSKITGTAAIRAVDRYGRWLSFNGGAELMDHHQVEGPFDEQDVCRWVLERSEGPDLDETFPRED